MQGSCIWEGMEHGVISDCEVETGSTGITGKTDRRQLPAGKPALPSW